MFWHRRDWSAGDVGWALARPLVVASIVLLLHGWLMRFDVAVAEDLGRFAACPPGQKYQCVIDARTFWLGSDLVQLDGLTSVPSVASPSCKWEAMAIRPSIDALVELLNNAGPKAVVKTIRISPGGVHFIRVSSPAYGDVADYLAGISMAHNGDGTDSPWCP